MLVKNFRDNEQLMAFYSDFITDINEFKELGKSIEAEEINKKMSCTEEFMLRPDVPPTPFYGNLLAEYVTIHLNPKAPLIDDEHISNFKRMIANEKSECFFNHLYNYGEKYSPKPTGSPTLSKRAGGSSTFDSKLLSFFNPFDIKYKNFNFILDKLGKPSVKIGENRKKLYDHRCQLELIPYGSNNFNFKFFPNEVLDKYFNRLLDVIFATDRKVVIFCGAVFHEIIQRLNRGDLTLGKITAISAIRDDGEKAQYTLNYSTCKIIRNNKTLKCIIAHTFPKPGLAGKLMEQYGDYIMSNEY
jgi:hypothetical protein